MDMPDTAGRRTRDALLALSLLLSACHDARDSSRTARQITVDTVPATAIPATAPDGAILFGQAEGATRFSNGNVAIADRSDATIRVFDPDGRPIRRIGRKGRGPGEFEYISALAQCGADSLYAFDYGLQRVTVYDSAGALQRTAYLPPTAMMTCSTSRVVILVQPLLDFFRPTEQNAGRLQHVPVSLIHGADTVRLYDSLPAADPRLGGRVPAFAVAGSHAFVGLTDSAFATRFDSTGTRRGEVRVSADPLPQTRAGFERALDVFFSRPDEASLKSMKPMFAKLPHPRLAPAYSALFGSPDGTLWTLLSTPLDSVTRLRATDPAGAPLGNVTLPFPMTTFEIGNDYILGLRENGLGEQRVVVYRMGGMGR